MSDEKNTQEKAAAEKAAAEDKAKTPSEKFQAAKKGKKAKCEFIASPTGLLKLAYNVGDVAEFTQGQVDFLADLGLAKKV